MGESHIFREGEMEKRSLREEKGDEDLARWNPRGEGSGRGITEEEVEEEERCAPRTKAPSFFMCFSFLLHFLSDALKDAARRRTTISSCSSDGITLLKLAAVGIWFQCWCWNLSILSFFFFHQEEREREGKERQLLQSGWVCSLPSFVLSVLLSKSWFFTSFSDQFFIFSFSWLNRSTTFWLNWFGLLVSNETWRTD